MTDPSGPDGERVPRLPRTLRTVRLEAFSDGVFAIAITLLVLDLAVPATEDAPLRALLDQWPAYLAYIVSFSTIGALWLGHSIVTEYLERVDAGFVRRNLALLLVVSFLPFPTRLLSEYVGSTEGERVAVTLYGLALLASVGLLSLLWRYSVRQGLIRADAEDDELRGLTERFTPGLAGYVALILLGVLLPVAAVIGYLLLAVFFLLPSGRRAGSRRRGA